MQVWSPVHRLVVYLSPVYPSRIAISARFRLEISGSFLTASNAVLEKSRLLPLSRGQFTLPTPPCSQPGAVYMQGPYRCSVRSMSQLSLLMPLVPTHLYGMVR